jgi:hypothetical protein
MKKNTLFTILSLAYFFAIGFSFYKVSFATDTASVVATVTFQNVSVTVASGNVAYGTMGASTSKDTNSMAATQIATNAGNVSEELRIKGKDDSPWTLSATPGADQYTHKFCKTSCETAGNYTALTTSYAQLAASVAAAGTQSFDLMIETPTTSTTYTQRSVDVTILAVGL